jgi:hypothetical protein
VAIHGYIPVDGEVILAEFDQREPASAVLAQLVAAQDGAEDGVSVFAELPGRPDFSPPVT